MQNDEAVLAMLHQLRGFGVRIAMDDFGTGYSSLNYLRSFPFDKIKIDRCFTTDADRNRGGGAIIQAIATLGASLGVETTAEGIETSDQLDLVRRAGCTEVQGYLIGRPRPAAELPAVFSEVSPRHGACRECGGLIASVSIVRCGLRQVFLQDLASTLHHKIILQSEQVDIGGQEATDRVLRRANYRLAAHVEGRVEHDGYPGKATERIDHFPKRLVILSCHGLDPRRSIEMDNRLCLLAPDRRGRHHEFHEIRTAHALHIEVRLHPLGYRSRGERPEFLAMFDARVDYVAHFDGPGSARMLGCRGRGARIPCGRETSPPPCRPRARRRPFLRCRRRG